MLDVAEHLYRWIKAGQDFAVATVVSVSGSAPRMPGAALAVDAGGTAVGSVSGGCVEGAVYEACREALDSGRSLVQRFGYSDEDAFAVGLTCGGVVDILTVPVRRTDAHRPLLASALAGVCADEAVALARVTDGPQPYIGRVLVFRGDGSMEGTLDGNAELDRVVAGEARALLDVGHTSTVTVGADGSYCGQPLRLLVEVSAPPPRMIVFGAVDFAAALVRLGKFLGYHVTVCDARPVFATRLRFEEADEVVVQWPHRYLESAGVDHRTVLCVLTHDARFDVPLLAHALRLPVAYVGAMGSRRTHEDRVRRLREVGVTEEELARLRAPIGLDLGARTPEETAVSIAAELVAARRGGGGAPLTGSAARIHKDVALR
ncbi:XdhC family protein [Streptomyces sp. Vc74B-19]|uniref:XdhC family protein n=1 Tax=unclassified Streptomyces TaxID=2593676 RepID=UPI001BFC3BE7|nr:MULTISPECIES: XdhC/CoxI family protein [unclassified Streptomyces]MBT3162209.1 XdhC family protein [Streptomyces sp. Vc74B-19]MCO4700564.1 XdhC family protein [Streptomyces sp. RO-S4]